MSTRTKCLVTGGAGFVGQRLVRALVEAGDYEVKVLDLRPPPEDAPFPSAVKFVIGDLTKPEQVLSALEGVQVVFHVATAAPTSENSLSQDLMRRVNVDGTRNVIDACIQQGVEKLIYTSSASVVFDGSDILYKGEDEMGYASLPGDFYVATKIEGEQLVLTANGEGKRLATCALRPSAIFGEGDTLYLPTLVKRAKEGKMKYMIGDGENIYDFTYVGNVVQAHLVAEQRLSLDSPIAGQAYFITNQEPRKFWEFSGDLLEGLGYDRPYIRLPVWLMLIVVFILQFIVTPLLKPFVKLSSDLSLNRIRLASRNRAFNPNKAIEQLGYRPAVSMSEAKERTIAAFQHLKRKPGN